jgi:hypothetical protein
MRATSTAHRFVFSAGVLLIGTSFAHFLNINETLVAEKTGDIAKAYVASVTGMWIFSGMCMLLLGIWLLFLSKDLKSGSRKAWWQAVIIGVCLTAFGIICWQLFPAALYFLYFSLIGILLLVPLFTPSRRHRSTDASDS